MNNLDNHLFSIDDDIFCSYGLAKIKQSLNCEQVFIYQLDSQQHLKKIIYPSVARDKKIELDYQYQYIVKNSESLIKKAIDDLELQDEDSEDTTIPIQRAQLIIPLELKTPEIITINNNIKLWGILLIYDYNYLRQWSREEKKLVDEIVIQMTLALEKNILYGQFKKLEKNILIYQCFDRETGLINYSSFLDCLEYEWHNLTRDKEFLSLILISLEARNKINSNLWRNIVEIIQQEVKRPADIVARYDGDKVVAMLPKTNNNGALCVNQKIMAKILAYSNRQSDYQFRSSIVTYLPNTEQNYEFLLAQLEKPFNHDLDFSENIYNQSLV